MVKPVLLILSMLLSASCSSTEPEEALFSNERALLGSWQRFLVSDQVQALLHFQESGAYLVSYGQLTPEGTYRFDSGGLLIVEDEGCGMFAGVYATTFMAEGDSLLLDVIEDGCQIRETRWPGAWTRVGVAQEMQR